MQFPSQAGLGLLAGVMMLASTAGAWAQSCEDLWYERNSVYKRAGYCFKTPRAIAAFGNAGCMYDSEYQLPMSPRQRNRVAWIVRMERQLGCR
jgi:hypothetical protein